MSAIGLQGRGEELLKFLLGMSSLAIETVKDLRRMLGTLGDDAQFLEGGL